MSQKVRRLGWFNRDRAAEYLRGKGQRTIGPNTYMVDRGEYIAIVFHATEIIRYYPDGRVLLYSGGYRTATTKQRLSALSPVHVVQVKHQWYVGDQEFTEGMNVGT